MTLAERAIQAANSVARLWDGDGAVFDATDPYIVVYSTAFSPVRPWLQRKGYCDFPVYFQRPGQLVGPRPACER